MDNITNPTAEANTENNTETLHRTTFDGGITPEQIEAWKRKHRKVVRIDVVDGDELHVGYFHRPDMATVKAVTKVGQNDEMRAGEVVFDNCWLGGSDLLRQDAVMFMAVVKQLGAMLNGCMSSLKNL